MPKQKRRRRTLAGFKTGDRVRVRPGIRDNDYPDMPMGGWAGTIAEVHDDGMYTVRWTEETMTSIHSVFKKRCENDGLDFETYWLGADDLEPDPGGPLHIEQPKKVTPRPLSPKDQGDRVRMVLGLTSDDPLPDVDHESLKTYGDHLSKNLALPFLAEHGAEYGHPDRIKVLGLGDADGEPMIDDNRGILCDARMEGDLVTLPLSKIDEVRGSQNRRLIDDYRYWFWNWQ